MVFMSKLRSKIPSAQSLFAFEVASKTLNFKQAAAQLNVTQSSISHAIRKLENHLRTKLFIRDNRGVRLTKDGQLLSEAIEIGFSRIVNAIKQIDGNNQDVVTIAVSSSMATSWLMPQLHEIYRNFSPIRLKVVTIDRNIKPGEGIDLTIRRLPLDNDHPNARLLSKETVFPVCSASYLERSPPLNEISDLLNHKLIYHSEEFRRRVNWADFLAVYDLQPVTSSTDLLLNDYQLALQAAMAGEGVTIGWTITGRYLLEDGRLVRPLKEEYSTDFGFYILEEQNAPMKSNANMIADWLIDQSKCLR